MWPSAVLFKQHFSFTVNVVVVFSVFASLSFTISCTRLGSHSPITQEPYWLNVNVHVCVCATTFCVCVCDFMYISLQRSLNFCTFCHRFCCCCCCYCWCCMDHFLQCKTHTYTSKQLCRYGCSSIFLLGWRWTSLNCTHTHTLAWTGCQSLVEHNKREEKK